MARLLAVDDNEFIRELLRDLLSSEGFEVELAASQQEAQTLLGRERFNLILTDLNGLASAAPPSDWLRNLKTAARGAPVVLLTADTCAAHLNLLENGLADVILKPFDAVALAERLHALVQPGAA